MMDLDDSKISAILRVILPIFYSITIHTNTKRPFGLRGNLPRLGLVNCQVLPILTEHSAHQVVPGKAQVITAVVVVVVVGLTAEEREVGE